ncbi:MAG: hypothetical protein ACREEX_08705 [Caulobacteraceae bacterium]
MAPADPLKARVWRQPLANPRREAFAAALARGATFPEATAAAGYSWARYGARLADAPDIVGRAEAIRSRLAGGGSREMGALIDLLLDTALEARSGRLPYQAAGAARSLYDLAGKLKQLLPEPGTTAEFIGPDRAPDAEIELTEAEWLAKFGPVPPIKAVER